LGCIFFGFVLRVVVVVDLSSEWQVGSKISCRQSMEILNLGFTPRLHPRLWTIFSN
jgi:hypothetical protein